MALPKPKAQNPSNIEQTNFWQWLFLALWLCTLFAWFISAKRPFQRKKIVNGDNSKVNNTYLALMAGCKQNNGESALTCLLPWARSQSSNKAQSEALTTLDALHTYFNDPALSNAIIALQQSHYGKEPSPWSGSELLAAIQAIHKQKHNKSLADGININP